MTEISPADPAALALDRSRLAAGWPLLAAVAVWAIGLPLLPRFSPELATGSVMATLACFAILAVIPAVVVLLRIPSDAIARPFVGLAATVGTLLILAPLNQPAHPGGLIAFLLVAPWRYALPPLVVHFALETGWPHLRQRWSGWIVGWYAIAVGMFVAVTVGLLIDETPLIDTIDGAFRATVIEPAAVVVAIVIVALALLTPTRGRSLRRALAWTLIAVVIGLVPLVAAEFIAPLTLQIDGAITPATIALLALPICGGLAVLALPFRDVLARELLAHRLAASLLEGDDLAPALNEIAASLHATFQTRGVAIRLSDPALVVATGEIDAPRADQHVATRIETGDEHQELIIPIGRAANPLGEIQLIARYAGAFGPTERDWLVALLRPIAAVLRVRRRELGADRRNAQLAAQLTTTLEQLATEATALPLGLADTGVAVPPPVDAREVLSQLSDGVTSVARHGEGLLSTAEDGRERARGASDSIARALDALTAFHAEIGEMTRHREDIAASNDVVSGIAFRTNLVANNAALEATRAGAAGRTFGVLADEVRRLAETTASTSSAISQRTTAMANEVTAMGATVEGIRHALAAAIRDAEAAELAAQQLMDAVTELEDTARSLRPAVAEANAVAQRRSSRDQHLTATLERFLTERSELTRALTRHRDAMTRLSRGLAQLTHDPGSR